MSNMVYVEVKAELASKASDVLERLGFDLEDAIRLFLRRCVIEQKLPFDINDCATPHMQIAQNNKRSASGGKITQDMVKCVWKAYEDYHIDGGDLRSIADDISSDTGMNAGSAFIYLVILDNLIQGQRNTRNMKMRDLEFYMSRIKEVYGNTAYRNALSSLKESIPYWESQPLGNFADKVRMYLQTQSGTESDDPIS